MPSVSSSGQAQSFLPRIVALGRRGDAELADLVAGQPIIEQIGDGQKGLGDLQLRRWLQDHGQELIERVELQELDAGLLEDLLARHAAERLFEHAVGAVVAVVDRVAEQRAAAVEQGEVDAPGVQPDAGDLAAVLAAGFGNAGFDVAPQAQHVPVQAVGQAHGAVGEAVHVGQCQPLAIKLAENCAAALRAEVESESVERLCHELLSFATRFGII